MSVSIIRVDKVSKFEEANVSDFPCGMLIEVEGKGPHVSTIYGLVSLYGLASYGNGVTVRARPYPVGTEFSISVNAEDIL